MSNQYSKSDTVKKRKKLLLTVVLIGGVGAIFMVSNKPKTADTTPDQQTQSREQSKIFQQQAKNDASKAAVSYGAVDNVSGQAKWMANSQQSIQDLNQQQNIQANQLNSTLTNQNKQQSTIESLNVQFEQLTKQIQDQQNLILNMQAAQTKNPQTTAPEAVKPSRQIIEIDLDGDNSDASGVISANKMNKEVKTSQKKDDPKNNDDGEYIPTQSFAKGNLVSALDANTGGNSSSDPTPFMIMLTDLTQLPNFVRKNLKNCFVGGSGFGDLSTERVKGRLTTLSCTLPNGHVIDIPVKGYVVGEDGKAGIKGVVAMHQGSIMAKATLAGFLAGIGTTAANASQTQMTSPVGTTSTINPNQAVGNALGTGAGMAFNNLSQYYINILNQIMPTIEVSSGRNVTVVFTEGIQLKEKLGASIMDNTNVALPFNQSGI